ncbi:MAG: radical SAM protein [Anaerolineales bacterium]|nr:radical SAM protein [Anaerolineales bacterium]
MTAIPIELTADTPTAPQIAPPKPASAPSVEWGYVDDEGRLVLSPEMRRSLGLEPGARMRIEHEGNTLRLHRPASHLAKVYIEPTDSCNLDCVTCFRNSWQTPIGRMSDETFEIILAGLARLDPMPTVYFGGIGEPMFHQRTTEWIARVKQLGARVEMITNGTLLTEQRSRQLIDAGLDVLWVSIDGATPENYADVRLGAELPKVLENLKRFRTLRKGHKTAKPEIGIAFVAMKRNIHDLPKVLMIARNLGALHFSVSNVLPVTDDPQAEVLYKQTMRSLSYINSSQTPHLSLPKMDFDEYTREALFAAFQSGFSVSYAGANWGGSNDVCDYVESGSMTIGWNGNVSPCWPLLHTHGSYLHQKAHTSFRHIVGNAHERELLDLWHDPAYVAYRERAGLCVPPCTFCGGCDASEDNLEDCIGNEFPTCGTCLWAQGLIRCP